MRKDFGNIILTILYIGFGLFCIFTPSTIAASLSVVLGILLIAVGAIRLISGLSDTSADSRMGAVMSRTDSIVGIVMIIAGLLVITFPNFIPTAASFLLGIYLAIDGVAKLVTLLPIRSFRMMSWWVAVAVSALLVIAGIVLMINPFVSVLTVVRVFGVILIVSAVQSIFTIAARSKATSVGPY